MQSLPLVDFGLRWFTDILSQVTDWFLAGLTDGLERLAAEFFDTPLPRSTGSDIVFSPPAPSDHPWRAIYDSTVAGETMILALLILVLCVQARHTVRIFNIGDDYQAYYTRRSAWTGAFLIVVWYWIAVLGLFVINGLTVVLLPDVSTVVAVLLNTLPTALANPAITLLMAVIGGVAMLTLEAVFFLRELLLYVYLYGMPLGIAIAFGNVPVISAIATRLCKQMIPLAALPLPAAVLFRGYELLFVGDAVIIPERAFLQYLVVVALPLLALFITWKTFKYASPITSRVIGTASVAAVTVGSVVGAGYAAGPYAASTAARWGPRAAAGHALSQRAFSSSGTDDTAQHAPQTTNDNLAPRSADGGVPAYRRAENDPGYY